MNTEEIHNELARSGHAVECVRVRADGQIEAVTPRRSAKERRRVKDPTRDAAEDSAWSAANAEALTLATRPNPMTYQEALGRAAMGERTAEVRNTIARGVARRAEARA